MKTAVSLPDRIFREAEALAARLGKSRSQLYAEAIAAYLARHDADGVTESLNRTIDSLDETLDAAVSAAAQDTLRRVEW